MRAATPCAAMPAWDAYKDLNTRLAAPIEGFAPPEHWSRKQLRSMGRVSQLAVRAAELALTDAGLLGDPVLRSGRVGVACGSSIGSTPDISDFAQMLLTGDAPGLNANSYVRMMPHTTGANVGIFFGLRGRIIPTSTACTSGSQGVGLRLRGDQARVPGRDARRRRRGTLPERGHGLRHAVRHESPQRRPGLDAASLRPRPRRPRDRRGRLHAGARGTRARAGPRRAHLRRGRRLRHQFRRHARHPSRGGDDARS